MKNLKEGTICKVTCWSLILESLSHLAWECHSPCAPSHMIRQVPKFEGKVIFLPEEQSFYSGLCTQILVHHAWAMLIRRNNSNRQRKKTTWWTGHSSRVLSFLCRSTWRQVEIFCLQIKTGCTTPHTWSRKLRQCQYFQWLAEGFCMLLDTWKNCKRDF